MVTIAQLASELVDTAGKLGPLCVAIAVYEANRQQTLWSNTMGRRAAEVEDQKLRLQLLERRVIAIEAVRDATQEFHTKGAATRDVIDKVFEALKVAELVFGDAEEAAIEACLMSLLQWQMHDRARLTWRDKDAAKLDAAVNAMLTVETKILDQLDELRKSLRAAAKVRQLPLPERHRNR